MGVCNMKKVLVAGATGYLGKYVVREFKQQGFWVRALVRNKKKLKEEILEAWVFSALIDGEGM